MIWNIIEDSMKETSATIKLDGLFQGLKTSKTFGTSYRSKKKANVIHHCINRKYSDILRWDYRNAIPLNVSCEDNEHDNVAEARTEFDWGLDQDRVDYINKHKNMLLKDYLMENNLSKEEFMDIKKRELLHIINNY